MPDGTATPAEPLLAVRDLKKHYQLAGGKVLKAVDGASFEIGAGETLGLVGESGCGKSTLGRAVLRLIEPTAGAVLFEGEDLVPLPREQLRKRRRAFQIVSQDPYASLNPRMTAGQIIAEPFLIQKLAGRREAAAKAQDLLELVGLRREFASRYPHEFSGGQRQRISIARALALNPRLVVCDESVSALDVSIQAQIINLLMALQRQLKLTYLFISHDLRVVKHISDNVAVMYLGKIVEIAPTQTLFDNTAHPYSVSLLSAIPSYDPAARKTRVVLKGDMPSPIDPPKGCPFHTRCYKAQDLCRTSEPTLQPRGERHLSACHFPEH